MEMGRLARGGTAEPVSRVQILRHERGQGNIHFPCSADHEQDWQAYPVNTYSAICDYQTYLRPLLLYGDYVVRFPLPDGVFLPCDYRLDFLQQFV